MPANNYECCTRPLQVAKVDAARVEILATMRRRKHQQASEEVLLATKLRSSSLGWRFHLEDLMGKGLLQRSVHGSVASYRLPKR